MIVLYLVSHFSEKNRGICKRKSGGVGVFVKNRLLDRLMIIENVDYKKRIDQHLLTHYSFVDSSISEEVMLLKFKNTIEYEGIVHDLHVLLTYIPPEGSAYANKNVFCEIESTLLQLNAEVVLVVGDLNARTRCIEDYMDETDVNDVTNDRHNGVVEHCKSQSITR